MKKKTETKSSIVPLIVGIIVLLLAVICLPIVNNVFWKSGPSEVEEIKEAKEQIPNRYQCSYGPQVDSFYNYIRYEYVIFDFDEKGNLVSLNSETRYQVTSLNDYNQMLKVLTLPTENVIYDSENYVVTVRSNENTVFPENYKDLKKYLSTNQYTCVVE